MKPRILVATDTTPAAAGALRMARPLAERLGAVVDIVTVVEPIPIFGATTADMITYTHAQLGHEGAAASVERVRRQLEELGLQGLGWDITLEIGPAAPSIVRCALDRKATLILLGIGRHALADRWFGSETALRVMRIAHVPVLAVPETARDLPRVALAAVDFTEFSHAAARTAASILAPGGVLHLAHVLLAPSTETAWVGGTDWIDSYRESVSAGLAELARSIERERNVRVDRHVLAGSPARELLDLAEHHDVGLVAAGSHGSGFLGRVLMGSVSTRLVRGTTRAVLIVPPQVVPAEVMVPVASGAIASQLPARDYMPAQTAPVGPV